jgi:hypothetical protein
MRGAEKKPGGLLVAMLYAIPGALLLVPGFYILATTGAVTLVLILGTALVLTGAWMIPRADAKPSRRASDRDLGPSMRPPTDQ